MRVRNEAGTTIPVGFKEAPPADLTWRQGLLAVSGFLGALAVSSCCVLPLVLFSLGISGAWIGNLAALSPYQPYFAAVTLILIGTGFYKVYRAPTAATCRDAGRCGTPRSRQITKSVLWMSVVLVLAALSFPYYAPFLLDA